jgi:hypothetical protein
MKNAARCPGDDRPRRLSPEDVEVQGAAQNRKAVLAGEGRDSRAVGRNRLAGLLQRDLERGAEDGRTRLDARRVDRAASEPREVG